jgi:hypothetical protein
VTIKLPRNAVQQSADVVDGPAIPAVPDA